MRDIKIDLLRVRDSNLKQAAKRQYKVNLDNPTKFCDKLHWLKIYDVVPLKVVCADKLLSRMYVEKKLGVDLGVPLLGVWDDANQIDWDKLPRKCVIKTNQISGRVLFVDQDSKNFSREKSIEKLNKWLKIDWSSKFYEMHYRGIESKIFAEAMVCDKDNGYDEPQDTKFFCFNGNPEYVQFIPDRHGKTPHLSMYDKQFNLMENWGELAKQFKTKENADEKPACYDEMVRCAKILSEDFKYVRVDFFCLGDKFYFNELTFVPDAGYTMYTKPEVEKTMGELLNLGDKHEENENKIIVRASELNDEYDLYKWLDEKNIPYAKN